MAWSVRRRISSNVTIRDPNAIDPIDLKARPREWRVGWFGCKGHCHHESSESKSKRGLSLTYHSAIVFISWAKIVPPPEWPASECGKSHVTDYLPCPEIREGKEEYDACHFARLVVDVQYTVLVTGLNE